MQIGIIGSGAMGNGIAQVAAMAGHAVIVNDNKDEALAKAEEKLKKILARLVEKGKITEEKQAEVLSLITYSENASSMSDADLVIEAIVEDMDVKKQVFGWLESIVSEDCILATNTSSLSVAAIAGACQQPERVMGIHFFNPAPLMPLVEIVPAVQTDRALVEKARAWIDSWGKTTVLTKDTPGFIVNRVARPFYGEALRMYEEGIASFATIDWAMKEIGGFRMGPFTLMDFIGNDVNYAVTCSVFEAFYYDPRYRPSLTQKSLSDAGWLGRKSGRGYFDYSDGAQKPEAQQDQALGQLIVDRIVAMLINEAADALYLNIASRDDLDLAMTKGVNYPKGLLAWADEIGIQTCVDRLDHLHETYLEDRYRCSPMLRALARDGKTFY